MGYQFTVRRKKAVACDELCAQGFRCDRDHGLIYGPFFFNGEPVYCAEDFSILTKSCVYCGNPVTLKENEDESK